MDSTANTSHDVGTPDPKTVRLARGRHRSAHDGACVVELASMLAGEPFTDHPRSVCPVIAGFLRVYNDALPDHCRHELLPYAAMAVGTRADRRVRRWRSMTLMRWAYRQRSEWRIRLTSRVCAATLVAENVARDAARLPGSSRRAEVDRLVEQLVRGPASAESSRATWVHDLVDDPAVLAEPAGAFESMALEHRHRGVVEERG